MSKGHILTVDEKMCWKQFVLTSLDLVYETKSRVVFLYVLIQIYEYCAACLSTSANLPLKITVFREHYGKDTELYKLCHKLYILRNIAVHQMYIDNNYLTNKIIEVMQDSNFKVLLKEFFPDDYEEFDDLIYGYSQYI